MCSRTAAAGERDPRNRGEGAPLPADASLFEIVADFERRKIIERWSSATGARPKRPKACTFRCPR